MDMCKYMYKLKINIHDKYYGKINVGKSKMENI